MSLRKFENANSSEQFRTPHTNAGYQERHAKRRSQYVRIENDRCTYCGRKATEGDHVPPLFVADENTTGRLVSACRACNGDLRMCASANLRERLVYAWCYASRRRFWADANGTSTFSLKQRQADRDRIQKLKHRCELLAQLMAREGKDPHEMFERVKETVRQRMFVMATNLCIAEAARMKGARVVKQREPK